jgi:hypothetical protein
MKIREKCSCGAVFQASGDEATQLYKNWIRRHSCPAPSHEDALNFRDTDSSSTIGFAADYSGTGLDLPAKKFDPWEDE